nr:CRISPR-associated protein Cas4 [uncultured Vibrio sp.]
MDTRLIPLSALQHYVFCPRQCALIHNEQAWADNFLTAQGIQLHERVDHGEPETRKGIRYERGVAVAAPTLGLTGKLDLLEYNKKSHCYIPVEYKRGRPKIDDCDTIQLCAQALCIEEMTSASVTTGALWYWQTRKRCEVAIDDALRHKTLTTIADVKQLLLEGKTPKAKWGSTCKACSLIELCYPKLLSRDKTKRYLSALFATGDSE